MKVTKKLQICEISFVNSARENHPESEIVTKWKPHIANSLLSEKHYGFTSATHPFTIVKRGICLYHNTIPSNQYSKYICALALIKLSV